MKRILEISAKCSDMFSACLVEDGTTVAEYNGYVPKFFPGKHYGDYVMLEIDIDTGQIVNWKKPSDIAIEDFIESTEKVGAGKGFN